MESVPTNEGVRRNAGRESGSATAWTAAAVLTVVACVVFMAGRGAREAEPRRMEKPPVKAPFVAAKKENPPSPVPKVVETKSKRADPKPSDLEAARARLEELAKTYLPQAPVYREQLARVRALEEIEREHAGEPRALKAARVELAVALTQGLASGHPKVRELEARLEELERRLAAGEG